MMMKITVQAAPASNCIKISSYNSMGLDIGVVKTVKFDIFCVSIVLYNIFCYIMNKNNKNDVVKVIIFASKYSNTSSHGVTYERSCVRIL